MGDIITITDANGIVRIVGVMSDPGATPTHVLTIDADEEVSAQPGGAGGSLVLVTFSVNLQAASGDIIVPNNIVGGSSFAGHGFAAVTDAPKVTAMGGHVVAGSAATLITAGVVPSTLDALDLAIFGYATDLTGANTATFAATTSVASPVTDTAKTLAGTAGTWTPVTGADLSDDGSGNLKSTAGGVFVVQFAASVSWD